MKECRKYSGPDNIEVLFQKAVLESESDLMRYCWKKHSI